MKTEEEITGIKTKYKEKIIALISALVPDAKIYLFGSRACGDWRHSSDVDVCIDTGEQLEISTVGELKDIFTMATIPHTIDVVDFNFVSPAMKKMILKERIVWKEEFCKCH